MAKIAGKASSLSYNGTTIPITKFTPKHNRDLPDSTDSSNYDVSSDMLHKAQIPVALQTELAVEGFYDTSITNTSMIQQFYTAATAVAVILTLKSGTVYGHGNFDMSDFTTEAPVGDIIKWSANLKSNGVFTPGS